MKTKIRGKFRDQNGKKFTYRQVIDAAKGEPFDMSTLSQTEQRIILEAINQGIDSHLEACFVPARGDSTNWPTFEKAVLDNHPVHGIRQTKGRLELAFSPESLAVFLRRLFEDFDGDGTDGDDYDESSSLGSAILTTLFDRDEEDEEEEDEDGRDPAVVAAQYGSDDSFVRPPLQSGDGFLFYNFAQEERNPEFLRQFIPAIGRMIQLFQNETTASSDEAQIAELQWLKEYCENQLKSL